MNTHKCVWGFVLLPFAIAPVYAAGPELSTITRRQLTENYGKLPLSFEVNQGQADPQVRYLSRGSSYGFYLTAHGAVLMLQSRKSQSEEQGSTAVLRMELVGANAKAVISGENRLPGTSNYFVGTDAKHWHTNIPTYAAVKYAGVYQGIDLVYHGKQQQLEYDFVLAARAKPECIQLSFDGSKAVSIDGSGDLRITTTGDNTLVMHAPVAYQESDGERRLVAVGYVLHSRTRVEFRLGTYDRSRPLVIDPTLVYSTYLGGGYPDGISGGIAVDAAGSAYITGGTESINFPVTPGAFRTNFSGGGCGATECSADAYISKLNADGSALVYSTYLGGSDFSGGRVSIAVDASGNAYVAGSTNSTDFPTTPGAFQPKYLGNNGLCDDLICTHAFVSKLNAGGSALVYSTYLGGTSRDVSRGIAVDTSGNAYVTGDTMSSDFPTTPGALQTKIGGGYLGDAFVSKLNAAGSGLIYSTYLGGGDTDAGWGIAVDTSGNAYVTGGTSSVDFPTTPGAFQTSYGGVVDVFVTKLNAAGSAAVYSTYLGGSGGDGGTDVTIDSSGNAYITGSTSSPDFPTTPGAFQTSYGGVENAFVSRLNTTGSALVYSTYLGGSSADIGYGITIDTSGSAYVTGFTTSVNFPTTSGAFQPACNSSGFPYVCADAFVSRLSASGSALVYSTYLGGTDDDEGVGIALDGSGNAYVAGWTRSPNFPVTPDAFQPAFGGFIDAFITKFQFGIPFVTFKPRLRLDVHKGAFDLRARFALGKGSSINPATQPVILGIGRYSVTISAGSFKRQGKDYRFKGVIAGVHLEMFIHSRDLSPSEDSNCHTCEGNQAPYELTADGKGANLSGITNPVAVSLGIGKNTGTAKVIAQFD